MTAILDGLIATGATFEAVADEAGTLGYQVKERRLKPPLAGSVFVDEKGLLQCVRYQLIGWVMSVDGDSKIHVTRWRKHLLWVATYLSQTVLITPSQFNGSLSLWLCLRDCYF